MSSAAAFHNWIGLIFSVLSLAGVGILFWLALRRAPLRRPSCGSCGYAVEGLEALSCPECGSDLRKVGIETPRRRMLHPGLFVLFWSLLLVVPFATAFTTAMRMGPRMIVADATFGLTSTSGTMPQLHIDQRIEALVVGKGVSVTSASIDTMSQGEIMTTTIRFPRISAADVRESVVDVRTAVDAVQAVPSKLTLENGGDPAGIDAAALSPVFGDRPMDFPEEAAEVAALLNAMMAGETSFTTIRLKIAGNNIMRSRTVMAGWYAPALVTIGAVLYALGIVVYLVLRRKRLSSERA